MAADNQRIAALISEYSAGPVLLSKALTGVSREQRIARPVPGKWSIHEVVCHLSDCEGLYADRIKRALAEDQPTLPGLDPDLHVKVAFPDRDVEEELRIIELVRSQMTRILKTLSPADFERIGIHAEAGPLTVEALLARIAPHISHHVKFINEKRAALGV